MFFFFCLFFGFFGWFLLLIWGGKLFFFFLVFVVCFLFFFFLDGDFFGEEVFVADVDCCLYCQYFVFLYFVDLCNQIVYKNFIQLMIYFVFVNCLYSYSNYRIQIYNSCYYSCSSYFGRSRNQFDFFRSEGIGLQSCSQSRFGWCCNSQRCFCIGDNFVLQDLLQQQQQYSWIVDFGQGFVFQFNLIK